MHVLDVSNVFDISNVLIAIIVPIVLNMTDVVNAPYGAHVPIFPMSFKSPNSIMPPAWPIF